MKRYAHIFFDLDHTLWDFRTNSRTTLNALFHDERLVDLGVPDAASFIEVYEEVNQGLWGRYESGHIPKEVLRVLRFRNTLLQFGVKHEDLAIRLGHAYLERSPLGPHLMPGARELLSDLAKDHRLHIITNGFDEVQHVKLASSGIAELFDVVLTSERAGAGKPDRRIYDLALRRSGAQASESLMVGDSIHTDMEGARRAGWDHVHYAAACEPDPKATYRVRHMDELRAILF